MTQNLVNSKVLCYYFWMNYHIVTIFPDILDSYLTESILGRAIENKIITVRTYALREYTGDKHRRVDGKAYGGGPGMVMWVDPIVNCVEKIKSDIEKRLERENKKIEKKYEKDLEKFELYKVDIEKTNTEKSKSNQGKKNNKIIKPAKLKVLKSKILIINFSPGGKSFNTEVAKETSQKYTDIIFICGRYEGVDSRVVDILKAEEWSIGDYVLTGGEVAAAVCIDSISRQISGVLNKKESLEENRISSHNVYSRPEIYEYKKKVVNKKTGQEKVITKKFSVPKVLLSGNHKEIDKWKLGHSLES